MGLTHLDTFHIIAVPSPPPVATLSPLGFHATAII